MPRSATSDELALLASGNYTVWYQVWYENASGTLVDLTNLAGGIDALVGPIEIDRDIDQSIDALTFRVKRDLGPMPSLTAIDFRYLVGDNLSAATMTRASTASYLRNTAPTDRLSLSPLRTDSTLNRFDDGVTYGALLDLGRSVIVKTAAVGLGAAKPATGDAAWKTMFQGFTDTVTDDDASDATLEVKARNLGAVVADKWIGPARHDYTSLPAGGKPIQDVAQEILNAAIRTDLGDPLVTVVTPVDPGYDIKTFSWSTESVIDVLTRLIQVIGADLRYRWDDATSAFQYQFTVPDRTKSTPDALIGPNQYMSVHQLALDRTDVRNDITVYYGLVVDETTGARASNDTGTGSDATSIARYRRRTAVDSEATDSPIDTLAEANRLAGLILSDLKDPKATQQIEMLYYWPVDLWDLHGYLPNGVHYDTQQNLSVVHIRHLLGANGGTQHRTLVDVRGTPAGSYLGWLTRMVGGTVLHAGDKPIASLTLASETDTTVNLTLGGSAAPNLTNFLDFRVRQSTGAAMPDWPDWVSGATVSPGTFPTTTVNLAVTRLPIRTVRVELQVRQLDGQISDIVAYTVGAHVPSIDPGSGLPHRPVAFVEGGYAAHSTTSDGRTLHAAVTDASSRPVDEMFHKFSDTADDIDDGGTHRVPLLAEADGGGWAHAGLNASGDVNRPVPLVHAVANVPAIKSTSGKLDPTIALDGTTGTPVHTQHAVAVLTDGADVTDGATRARGALDATTHELVTAVGAAATIAGLPSTVVGKKLGAYFAETWDALPSAATGWAVSGGALTVAIDATATMGPNLLRSGGDSILQGPKLAFNPNKLYRIRVRVLTNSYNTGGSGVSLWYLGVLQTDYTGAATNDNDGAGYIAAQGDNPGLGADHEYVSWFKGATQPFTNHSLWAVSSPTSPIALNSGTVAIQPYLLMGYNGTGGSFFCDYFLIDEFDEDGSMRTYSALGSDGSVYVPDTTTVKVGTQSVPSTLSKTLRLSSALFTVDDSTKPAQLNVTTGLRSSSALSISAPGFDAPVILPRGSTLTAARCRVHATAAETNSQLFNIIRVTDTGTATVIGTFNSTIATGWGTITLSLSETISSTDSYFVQVGLSNHTTANNVGFQYVEFDYTVPDYKTTV